MILIKKIVTTVLLLLIAAIWFGRLPKDLSDRIARALVVIFILGFAIRVGAYLMARR